MMIRPAQLLVLLAAVSSTNGFTLPNHQQRTAAGAVTTSRTTTSLRYSEDEQQPEGNNDNTSGESENVPNNNSHRHQERFELKNSDRARLERDLEQAMDMDWRMFRAKLIAQEKMYCIEHKEPVSRRKEDLMNNNGVNDKEKTTEDLFAGDHIGKQPRRPDPYHPDHPHNVHRRHNHQQQHYNNNNYRRQYGGQNMEVLYNDDPFVSEAELPLLIPKTQINKHRWAHEIPHLEAGCVLIANERLGGIFHQTVVLIVQHCEHEGTFGVVINRPMQGGIMKAAAGPTNLDLSLKMAFKESQVTYGGPVMTDDFSVLHSFGEVTGARKVCPGVYIGGSDELMTQVRCGVMDPKRALFVKGHSAWEPGQLYNEIRHGVWYTAAVSADFCLRYAGVELGPEDNPNDLWSDILQCMGGKYEDIARRYGGTGDARRAMP